MEQLKALLTAEEVDQLHTLLIRQPELLLVTSPKGNTILHIAIERNFFLGIGAILDAIDATNTNITEIVDRNGNTACNVAVYRNRPILVELLASRYPDLIHVTDDNQRRTPLALAAQRGHQTIVEILLRIGGYHLLTPKEGLIPIVQAVAGEQPEMVEFLLRLNPQQLPDSKMASKMLVVAVEHTSLNMVRFMLKLIRDYLFPGIDFEDEEIFTQSPNTPKGKIVEKWVKFIDYQPKRGHTAFAMAAKTGKVDIMKYLIKCGSLAMDTSVMGNKTTPLHLATIENRIDAVKFLLKRGTQVILQSDDQGRTPIYWALKKQDPTILRMFLQLSIYVMQRWHEGNRIICGYALTPSQLLLARSARLRHQANFSIERVNMMQPSLKEKNTLMHYSASAGSAACVQTLIEFGADIEERNKDRKLPIHYAIEGGHIDVMTTLLRSGQSLETTEKPSLLFTASEHLHDHPEAFYVLRALGATFFDEQLPIPEHVLPHMRRMLDLDFVLSIRYSVYFSTSLTYRLLFSSR